MRLAQLLRPRLAPVLDLLSRYGATPLVALPTAPHTPAPAQPMPPAPDGFSLDEVVHGALDAFGIGALGDDT